jgi:UDP-galactopyranose mutase
MKTAIVLGGGFTGCAWALLLSQHGYRVTIFEREAQLGGGCRTLHCGGHPYTLGPRHLFTPHEDALRFLEPLVPMRRLHHYLLTYVEQDGEFYSYPVHADDLPKMPDRARIEAELADRRDPAEARNFEEYWIHSVGATLYEKFVKNYSKKMWQVESNTLLTDFKFDGKGVQLRTGTREVNPHYHVYYPIGLDGWDRFFAIVAASPGIQVRLSTPLEAFDVHDPGVRADGTWHRADLMVSSLSPDLLMEKCYGELPYIGRDMLTLILPCEQVIPDPVFFLHYAGNQAYTRVVEYKKLTGYRSPNTLLGIEFPSTKNKLYPYPIKAEQEKARRYIAEFSDRLVSAGRMGNYRYFDIGDVVHEALTRIKEL